MGGRGAYSYSSVERNDSSGAEPLSAYAVAAINRDISRGTNPEAAIARFRENMMDENVEYSAYIDDYGYAHALASAGDAHSTQMAPLNEIAHERAVSRIIHNHPGVGRKWGGPLSDADIQTLVQGYNYTKGRINAIVATAREGTYSARMTRPVTHFEVDTAINKAKQTAYKRKYTSEMAMWRGVHNAYASELGKIGIELTFNEGRRKRRRLITQKIGTY